MKNAKNRTTQKVSGDVGIQPSQNEVTITSAEVTIATGSEVGLTDSADARIDPAEEHITAASPHAARLSDGSAFYEALTDTQLRATPVPVSGAITSSIAGDIAHDAADSGNPVKIGLKAIAHGANPTAVAADDRTNWYANRAGVPFVMGGHPNIVCVKANYTAAQTDTAIITVGSGVKIVVTKISVASDNATVVDVGFTIGFGAANTPTTTGVVLSHPGLGGGDFIVEGSGSGILGIGADGEDLRITSEVPTTGSIDVNVSYYTIES